jgi:aromatic ring-opening dioxygenase catalytic subunit (LigB family)
MGEIVAAMATMHAPQLFTRPPEEDPGQLDAGIAAMRRLGRLLDRTQPDALMLFASDHMETFFLKSVPTFAIIAGEYADAKFAGRAWTPPIHMALVEDLLEQLVRRNFDMAYSQEAELGHSFAAPFEWVLEGRNIPVVPVFVNTYLPPLPSPRRCAALGKAIAEIVAGRRERVALLASGGMSHYPGTWKYYQPAYDFDRWCIAELENGHSDSFLDLTVEQLDEVGNTEMLPWAVVLGAIGEQSMELLSYQPTPHHGHAVAVFHPGPKPGAAPPARYVFQGHPYAFYKHPAISAYKLNKLLYESRFKPALRRRMLEQADIVAAEYGLGAQETAVLREVCKLPHNNTERAALDADPLVKLGAHPVGALMAVHVLQAEQRRLKGADLQPVLPGH